MNEKRKLISLRIHPTTKEMMDAHPEVKSWGKWFDKMVRKQFNNK